MENIDFTLKLSGKLFLRSTNAQLLLSLFITFILFLLSRLCVCLVNVSRSLVFSSVVFTIYTLSNVHLQKVFPISLVSLLLLFVHEFVAFYWRYSECYITHSHTRNAFLGPFFAVVETNIFVWTTSCFIILLGFCCFQRSCVFSHFSILFVFVSPLPGFLPFSLSLPLALSCFLFGLLSFSTSRNFRKHEPHQTAATRAVYWLYGLYCYSNGSSFFWKWTIARTYCTTLD